MLHKTVHSRKFRPCEITHVPNEDLAYYIEQLRKLYRKARRLERKWDFSPDEVAQ